MSQQHIFALLRLRVSKDSRSMRLYIKRPKSKGVPFFFFLKDHFLSNEGQIPKPTHIWGFFPYTVAKSEFN